MLDGDPGLGKSTLTLDLASRVTTARAMPDGLGLAAPACVLLCTAEDGLGDTVRPRLEAAGADLARVFSLGSVPDAEGVPRTLSLPDDVAAIARVVREHAVRLVVIIC